MKVRVGSLYTFERNGHDKFDGAHLEVADGTVVRVVNLSGCPKANVMGHCYIANVDTNRSYGLCDTRSLVSIVNEV